MNVDALLRQPVIPPLGRALLAVLTAALLTSQGCADRWAGPSGSYTTPLSLRLTFSAARDPESLIDAWRVQVIRPGEGVIAEDRGAVDPGQETIEVSRLSVTLQSECESLQLRLELLSQGVLWWEVNRTLQICAAGGNEMVVEEEDWAWGGPTQPVLSRRALQFVVPQGARESETLTLAYSGAGSLPWTLGVEETDARWLTLEPSSGSVTSTNPQAIDVSVDAADLASGTYHANLVLSGFAGPFQLVSVEMTVVPGPTLGITPGELLFEADEGTSPPAQTFTVRNEGAGTLEWTASPDVGWLHVSPASGTLSTSQSRVVTVSVSTASLSPGEYHANINVGAPTAQNSPQTLAVTLVVTLSPPVLERSPATMTFNAVEGGSNPATQTLSISNGGGGTLSWSVSEGASWLSLSPTSGTSTGEPDDVTVSVNIAGLAADTFHATITVTGATPATGSPQTTAVELVVAPPAPVLVRSPATMTFNAVEGGSNPETQTLSISNGGGGTLSWSVSDGASWLSLSPTSGTSTGETDHVTVSVNIAGLAADTFHATITVTGAPPATGSPKTTAVTLVVVPPAPVLQRSPATMTFNAVQGGPNPGAQTLSISNGGGGTLSWSVSEGASWLSLSPTSGTSTGEPDDVTVSVNIAGLAADTFHATITVTGAPPATGSPKTTAVTLVVVPPAPVLQRSPATMTFNAVQGGPNPETQTLSISNGGGGTLSWSVSEGASWLSLSPTSGTSTGETDDVTVSVNIAGLAADTFHATITVTGAAPATGSPKTTAVTLVVAPPAPVLVRSPATMTFDAVEGGPNPETQTLSISNGGGGTLSWSVSEAASWLSLSPTIGTSTGETDHVTVSVNIAGLAADTFHATITVTGAAPATGSPQTTAVTLVVAPPAPVLVRSPAAMTFNAVQGGSNPPTQTLSISNGGGGTLSWSVSEGASWLSLSPTSGTSTGETDPVTVSVNTTGLAADTFHATITVTGAAPATGSPKTTAVTLVVAETSTLEGHVRVDGTGVAGVTVLLTGPSSVSTTTNAAGAYSASYLVPGTYTVSLSGAPPSWEFPITSKTVTVAPGATAVVDFSGSDLWDSAVDPGPADTWTVGEPTSATTLCNGLGSASCASGGSTVTVTAVATGLSGSFNNPWGVSGKVYFYYVHPDLGPFFIGVVNAASAAITDDGITRFYTWSITFDAEGIPASTSAGGFVVVAVDGSHVAHGTPEHGSVQIVDGTLGG